MYFRKRQLTLKARRFFAVGNVCLFTGVMMTILGKDFALHHVAIYDGLRGFLIGLAITFNFFAFRLAQRCPASQPQS
jgi:hypothetical protein